MIRLYLIKQEKLIKGVDKQSQMCYNVDNEREEHDMKKNKTKVLNSIEATLLGHERFNPYQCGHGEHKSAKYPNRNKRKADTRKEVSES